MRLALTRSATPRRVAGPLLTGQCGGPKIFTLGRTEWSMDVCFTIDAKPQKIAFVKFPGRGWQVHGGPGGFSGPIPCAVRRAFKHSCL